MKERKSDENERTYVLQAVMAGHVSPVQNSEIVLYCRFMRLKKVVAAKDKRKDIQRSCDKTFTDISQSIKLK